MSTEVNFKVGDKVKVIRPTPYQSKIQEYGAVFTVIEIYENPDHNRTYVSLLVDGKASSGWDVDRFVKYEEKEKVLKVEMNKKYRKVNTHEPVRIICVDRVTEDNFGPIVGLVKRQDGLEEMLYLDSEGHKLFTKNKSIEEVPEVDWSKVQVDTLIWVDGIPHYFANSSKYYVYFFLNGRTSKTNTEPTTWAHKSNCSLEEPK